jgi:hypothetical protein
MVSASGKTGSGAALVPIVKPLFPEFGTSYLPRRTVRDPSSSGNVPLIFVKMTLQ